MRSCLTQSGETLFYPEGFATSVLSQTVEEPSATSPSSSFGGPLEHYNSLIRDGQLREDLQQRAVMEKLEQMQKNLRGYSNDRSSFFSKVNWPKSAQIYPADTGKVFFFFYNLNCICY